MKLVIGSPTPAPKIRRQLLSLTDIIRLMTTVNLSCLYNTTPPKNETTFLKVSGTLLTRQVASITKTISNDLVQTKPTDHSDETGEFANNTPPKKKMKFLPGLTRS